MFCPPIFVTLGKFWRSKKQYELTYIGEKLSYILSVQEMRIIRIISLGHTNCIWTVEYVLVNFNLSHPFELHSWNLLVLLFPLIFLTCQCGLRNTLKFVVWCCFFLTKSSFLWTTLFHWKGSLFDLYIDWCDILS